MPDLPEANPGYRWEMQVPDAPRRRRGPWPWIISIVVLVVLLGGAFLAGEWLARDVTERAVRTQVDEAIGLAPDQQIDVDIDGWLLLQLLSGRLDRVAISSDDVSYGDLSAAVDVELRGLPIRDEAPIDGGEFTVRLDEQQLRALLAQIDGFPADVVSFQDDDLQFALPYSVFGVEGEIGVTLAPGIEAGALTLAPETLFLGGASVSADELRAQLGPLADTALRTWTICLADEFPAALTLTDVQVASGTLAATGDVDPNVLVDASLSEPGACGEVP